MGNFFTSMQIYNPNQLDRDHFINFFSDEMKKSGYVLSNSDESELSYILRFADSCKWVTITSEAYEHENQLSKTDTIRIAKMLKTTCINTTVIDSDCAVMDLYDESGKKKDSLIMGRADDYFGDNIPQPSEKIWKTFLSSNSTWEQFSKICNENNVFVEDSLSKLAGIIGMDSGNILFSAEDAQEDEQTVFLYFKEARTSITMSQNGKIVYKAPQKLTQNTAFKQIIGKALEPYGFKVIKGRHPYIVRVINNEILHIITFRTETPDYSEGDRAFAIMGGIATIYRKKITLDQSPIQNYGWFNYMSGFYKSSVDKADIDIIGKLYISYYYSDRPESLISVFNDDAENLIKYVLPVFDKIDNIDSCIDYLNEYKMPRNTRQCTEICTYYPNEDEAFLNFLSEKVISDHPDFLDKFLTDTEFHNWVMCEIEKRKENNIEILKSYGIDV